MSDLSWSISPSPYPVQTVKPIDEIYSPAHYTRGGIETIDFIEAKGLDYRLGCVVKYVSRAGHKGDRSQYLQDLKKARWYLDRAIRRAELGKDPARAHSNSTSSTSDKAEG